jgi:hypothetical protein
LEELLPKDNEKMPPLDLDLIGPTEPQPFSADQMVRCDECLRANPPTRVNCLYCAAVLPVTEKTASLQKPTLRRLETWEAGYNIVPSQPVENLSDAELKEAAQLLKLSPDELQRIADSRRPLPLARAGSADEAALIIRRLEELNLKAMVLPDDELRLDEKDMVQIRSASLEENSFTGYTLAGGEGTTILLSELVLLVRGRLLTKRVEVKERRSRRAEDDLVHSSEFFNDESVLDIYGPPEKPIMRIEAGSFDFSVLGDRKALVTEQNLGRCVELLSELAAQVEVDAAYASCRQTIEPVWHSALRTEATGWHRDRPGRYSTSGATESSNENQFTRYSRLVYYLKRNEIRFA